MRTCWRRRSLFPNDGFGGVSQQSAAEIRVQGNILRDQRSASKYVESGEKCLMIRFSGSFLTAILRDNEKVVVLNGL